MVLALVFWFRNKLPFSNLAMDLNGLKTVVADIVVMK